MRARDVTLEVRDRPGSSPSENSTLRIYLHKSRRLLSALAAIVDEIAPRCIVEIARVLQTRAAVEILLPFVRPGGAYVIEDWAWGHRWNWPPQLWLERPLLSPLLSELMLICGRELGVGDPTLKTAWTARWSSVLPQWVYLRRIILYALGLRSSADAKTDELKSAESRLT